MNISDFSIGLAFQSHGGFRYQCTDVGSRTIAAIRLDVEDDVWLQGPPYLQTEILMDEHAIRSCYPDGDEGLRQMLSQATQGNHPGYSAEAVKLMIKGKFSESVRRYPREGLLKIDKAYGDDIAHPYSVEQEDDGSWHVLAYLVYAEQIIKMPEIDFAKLVTAKPQDFKIPGTGE